jgi:hypothetical protein
MFYLIWATLITAGPPSGADTVGSSANDSRTLPAGYTGDDPETMSQKEISCLLQSIMASPKAPGVRWSKELADTASQGLKDAISNLKLDRSKFTRTSFLHFLSQITYESGAGQFLIQLDAPAAQRGYGYLMVTGEGNRAAAAKCMNEADKGSDKGVVSDPQDTIGKDPYKAALASLCWWEQAMVKNVQNSRDCQGKSPKNVETVLRICNSGSRKGPIVNMYKSLGARQDYFRDLEDFDQAGICKNLGG